MIAASERVVFAAMQKQLFYLTGSGLEEEAFGLSK